MVESEKTDESTCNSKSDTVRCNEEEKVDRSRSGTEEEMFQAMWIDRNCINGDSRDKESSRGQIKLSELVGGELKDTLVLDGVESREGESREVEEPIESKEGNVVAHAVSVQGKLGEDLDLGSDKGFGLEARPLGNLTSLSGPVSNRVEGVAETNSVVKLGSKELVGGGANGKNYEQKKSWADKINEKVNSGHFDSRDSIEEDNTEDESGRGVNVSCSCWAAVMMRLRTGNIRGMGSDVKISVVTLKLKLHRIEVLLILERPWGVARSLAKIDTLACDCIHVLFKFVASSEVVLAIKLAQHGIN
ncbi:hypothetical protein V6N12_025511 [Hibiscus sabdariffa]|uniref:Uncharacterized protein n=1 Tax=Hibiscus sabdariffa TaxID=183260 RepID=A0ABR2CIQ4_9ROSI